MSIFNALLQKLVDAAVKINEKGIPLPLIRDNVKDRGSYPLTMFIVSFNIAIITLIGKITKFLGDVDYSNVLWLLTVTGSFWIAEIFNRKVNLDAANKKLDIGDKTSE